MFAVIKVKFLFLVFLALKEYPILVKLSLARQNNAKLELLHVAFIILRHTELAEFNLGLVKESGVTNCNKPYEIFGFVSLHRTKTKPSSVTGVLFCFPCLALKHVFTTISSLHTRLLTLLVRGYLTPH